MDRDGMPQHVDVNVTFILRPYLGKLLDKFKTFLEQRWT